MHDFCIEVSREITISPHGLTIGTLNSCSTHAWDKNIHGLPLGHLNEIAGLSKLVNPDDR